ncbi:hypothetical protein F443_23075 [Phytophthora nicotianae P1569]|uniref:Uncharacterized protein n=1 Tax=Phytophthora nicotianae P1569 TaxID=1317065 RepID=V9DSE7_PHYNI|nr:hypothetical protein F443_23075 [Phytophthora nicotianae P1569]
MAIIVAEYMVTVAMVANETTQALPSLLCWSIVRATAFTCPVRELQLVTLPVPVIVITFDGSSPPPIDRKSPISSTFSIQASDTMRLEEN